MYLAGVSLAFGPTAGPVAVPLLPVQHCARRSMPLVHGRVWPLLLLYVKISLLDVPCLYVSGPELLLLTVTPFLVGWLVETRRRALALYVVPMHVYLCAILALLAAMGLAVPPH